MTRNTWRHGAIVVKVCLILSDYVRQHPGWSLAAGDPGTKLGHDPDILRGPDVAMVRKERQPVGTGSEGWLEGAPDVAVEVAGDSQSASDLGKKALEYLRAGGRMVWVLDPEPRRIMLFTPPDHVRVLEAGEALLGADVLPGFSSPVSSFFE